ncbi:hypothetical protein [Streptomyces cavernicola]|uniref:ATP-binding protein n=1 Tax=Streptomyces cavernicola TaxID=3043613 RepID=A0ABT6SCZ1_9ACTN|nr:hypothetical protein [Streptomyces sp. B-S-A6]MDI3405839.1 hypothetical protein [Streptomyces sp. B-S-A6]
MKYSKAAAAVAGSVMALGTAAPALAADHTGQLPPMSLNGAVADTLAGGLDPQHLQATQGIHKGGDPLKPVTDVADGLSQGQSGAPQQVLGTVRQAAPLLGGLPTALGQ